MIRMSVLALCLAVTAMVLAAPQDEFIRVAPDHWSFETAVTHTRFIPFGANFVLTEKKYLNMFGPGIYNHALYDKALTAMQGLGLDIVKVFLPIAQVLPDPQVPGDARIAPGYLDNLADFLKLARAHDIRVEVSLTSWGGNGIKWWHEGGEYFGRHPWKKDAGIDSLDVLKHFWTKLGKRFRDNPTIFSYTPAVEWSFPAGNLTWTPPKQQWGRLMTKPGIWYWRAFLQAKYKSDIGALNKAYGTKYTSFDKVPVVDYSYNFATQKYADPDAKILDYQDFREWASKRYFKPQIAALRAADPNHMVTISNHMRRPDELWTGAARYFIGFSVPEESDMVDYFTSHDNHSASEIKPPTTVEDMLHGIILRTRFCNARKKLPLILEEMTFGSKTQQETAKVQAEMVRATIGSASGWMNWYLQYPHDANEADTPPTEKSALLNDDFTPTAWGLRAKALYAEMRKMNLSRKPAVSTISIDREKALVPHAGDSVAARIVHNWNKYAHPIDFSWPWDVWIDLKLVGDR